MKNLNTKSMSNILKMGYQTNLIYHHVQRRILTSQPYKTHPRNGECARTSEASIELLKSLLFPKVTYVQNNYDFRAINMCMCSISQPDSMGIAVHPDSQPYITFFVEGRGYFAYLHMPFGITGGPSEFGHVTSERFHNLIAKAILEFFVDDGGMAVNLFNEGIVKLRTLFDQVRKEKMSLSPSKLKLFMTEAVFAGAQVGPQGVSPDSTKLTAIVDWPIPEDASHLEGFLGLTSYFRDLVKGYAKIEGPLRNLLRQVPIPAGTKKHKYQQIM